MSAELLPTENDPPDEEGGNSLSTFDVVSELVTGSSLPAPVRRSLYKTLGRLCSSFVDIPVAYFEGKANEIRAATQARIQLTETTSEQIARQMHVDPEYARIAASKYGQKILREQVNLDMISNIAASDLRDSRKLENHTITDEVDDDWMDNFETEARKKSSEEMQFYFGRLLAGEITEPKSFSIKAVKILGEIDRKAATIFRRLCSVCTTHSNTDGTIADMRVPSLGGHAGSNDLARYGLSFGELNVLNEHGLIISDYNSWRDFGICRGVRISGTGTSAPLTAIRFPFFHQGKYWVLEPLGELKLDDELPVHGVALTRSGIELAKIVQTDPMHRFAQDLRAFFQNKGFTLIEVEDRQPQGLGAQGWRPLSSYP